MSIFNIDSLSDRSLISQFILEKRGHGLCLSREEDQLVCRWLKDSGSPDILLSLLDELIPEHSQGKRPLPLHVFNKKITERLTLMKQRNRIPLNPDAKGLAQQQNPGD